MDEALDVLQKLVLREGNDAELGAMSTIRAALAESTNSSHNSESAPCCPRLTRCDDGIWRCGILVS